MIGNSIPLPLEPTAIYSVAFLTTSLFGFWRFTDLPDANKNSEKKTVKHKVKCIL
jgi:hypothetical protein